jgi:hypothetical protein
LMQVPMEFQEEDDIPYLSYFEQTIQG